MLATALFLVLLCAMQVVHSSPVCCAIKTGSVNKTDYLLICADNSCPTGALSWQPPTPYTCAQCKLGSTLTLKRELNLSLVA